MVRATADAVALAAMRMPGVTQPSPLLSLPDTGFPAAKMFSQGVSYTYDDVILHPGHIYFGANEVRRQRRMAAAQSWHLGGLKCSMWVKAMFLVHAYPGAVVQGLLFARR
jgi:hypothetical protein